MAEQLSPHLSAEQRAVIRRMDAQIAREKRRKSLRKRAGTTLYGRELKEKVEKRKKARESRKSRRQPRRH